MKKINVLSLFDGISSGKLALEKAGIQVDQYFASEIDINPIIISERNHPDIKKLGDINNIGVKEIKDLPKIDLVIAGSPCQGFSRSGKGLNFEDTRSKLFFNFVEILSLIREHNNPEMKFLLENVNMKKEWQNVITDFVKVEPIQINSKLLSAQNRPRTYWTNIPGVEMPEDAGINLIDILEDVEVDYLVRGGIKISTEYIHNPLITVDFGKLKIKQATKAGFIIAEDGDGVNISFPNSTTRRGRVIKKKSPTLDTSCDVAVYANGLLRRMTITELERLQTLPDGYTDGVSMGARKKAIGNGWTIDVISHILKGLK